MPFTQSDIDALKTAISASGNSAQVRFANGSSVQYLQPAEAATLLTMMERDVRQAALDAGTNTRVRGFRVRMGGGY